MAELAAEGFGDASAPHSGFESARDRSVQGQTCTHVDVYTHVVVHPLNY